MIKSGALTKVGTDDGPVPISQIKYDDRILDFYEVTPYSVYSKCPAGTDSWVSHFAYNNAEKNRAGIANVFTTRYKNLKEGEAIHGNVLTGTNTYYKENGDLNITVTNDEVVNISGDSTVNVTGNSTVTVSGNVTINVTGNASVTVGGTTTLASTGNFSVTAPLTTINGKLTVTGVTNIQGRDFLTHNHTGSPTAPNGPVSNTGNVV